MTGAIPDKNRLVACRTRNALRKQNTQSATKLQAYSGHEGMYKRFVTTTRCATRTKIPRTEPSGAVRYR